MVKRFDVILIMMGWGLIFSGGKVKEFEMRNWAGYVSVVSINLSLLSLFKSLNFQSCYVFCNVY